MVTLVWKQRTRCSMYIRKAERVMVRSLEVCFKHRSTFPLYCTSQIHFTDQKLSNSDINLNYLNQFRRCSLQTVWSGCPNCKWVTWYRRCIHQPQIPYFPQSTPFCTDFRKEDKLLLNCTRMLVTCCSWLRCMSSMSSQTVTCCKTCFGRFSLRKFRLVEARVKILKITYTLCS